MRKFYFLFIVMLGLFINQIQAQQWRSNLPAKKDGNYTFFEYQKAFNDYCKSYDKSAQDLDDPENSEFGIPGYSQFKRWEWYWEPRVDPKTGEFPKKSAWEVWQDYKTANNIKSAGGTWINRGDEILDPIDAGSMQESGTGRLNCALFVPGDNNHYFIGAAAGGLWETTDNGTSWTCLTDNNPILGVSDIAIPPDYNKTTNPTIYIASGDRDAGDDPSIGVLKTTDGGATWSQTGLDFHDKSGVQIGRLIINPDDKNIMWAATSIGVYISTDQGANWTFVQGGNFIDMELLPGSTGTGSGTLIATTNGWSPKVYRSHDGGNTWTNTWTSPTTDEYRCDVAVTPAASNNVYIITADGTNSMAFHGLYVSTDGGVSFTQKYSGNTNNLYGWGANNAMSDGGQGWYDATLAVSNTNANVIYIAGVNGFVSTNGGTSFTICNAWDSGNGADVIHADHHNGYFRASDDRLFDVNDGGFYYCDNVTSGGSSNWYAKTDGLITGQLYDVGIAQTKNNEIISGFQDNGTKLCKVSTTDFDQVIGGDGMCCAINPTNNSIQYGTYAQMRVYKSTNEGGSFSVIRNSGSADWAGPVEADPQGGEVYIADDRVKQYKGTSTQWNNLSQSLDATNYLKVLAVFNDGTNKMIWTAGTSGCWKSPLGGGSGSGYTAISGLPADMVTDIDIDDDDYNHVYVCFGGYDNYNVYETTDGGSNWTDISAGLPAVPCGAIVINEQNTTKNEVYVGTDAGIYVKLGNAPWQLFNDGMPFVSITDLEIYYDVTPANTRIYASTYGRGVWSSDCYDPPTLDAAISYISVPADEYCALGNITPTVELGNIGTTTLTSATISYTIDGGAPVTQNWTGSLAQGATTNITFPSIALSYGAHDFVATVSNPNGGTDANSANDSKSKTFSVWNNDVPYTQSFDNFSPNIGYDGTSVVLEECWSNDGSESSLDWSVTQGETPSGSTGPSGDHTSGNGRYLYTEVSGISAATPVNLLSPTFDLTNYTSNQISFWYQMNGANCGSLQIDLYYAGSWHNGISAVWNGTTATSVSGNKGATWFQVTADISAADGDNNVQVRIASTTGTAYDGDIAIDDFNIQGVSACTQPATQASNITFSGITNNSITASWTSGSGDAEIVVVREGSAVNQDPTSGNTYTANTTFGSGSQIGVGNYVVYDGTAGSVTVTGLTPRTAYYFAVYTYNSADHCYNITELAGNTTTLGPPSVTTTAASGITGNSANSGGNVTSDNGAAVTARGVCWNTTGTPTTADSKTTDGSGTGTFVSSMTGLSAVTTYYVRAYATNSYGTSYGNEETFTTSCGTITSYPFTEGFEGGVFPPQCWTSYIGTNGLGNTNNWQTTTTANSGSVAAYVKYENVSGGTAEDWLVTPALHLGSSSQLTFYERESYTNDYGTNYYIRVSSTSQTDQASFSDVVTYGESNSTSYTQRTVDLSAYDGQTIYLAFVMIQDDGDDWFIDDINITSTSTVPPTVTTQAVSNISCTTATGNGNITDLGSPNPTAYGVCWNTTGTPTTADSHTDEGAASATGAFTSAMTGLTANTTYYVRAYATNSAGTSYGSEVTFTTDPNLAVSVSIAADANPVCAGTNVTFTATPTNGGGSPSYQWKLNGGNVGANSSTYSNSSLSDGDVVTCVLTSSETCTTGNPATSNAITMTVNPILAVSVSIAADANPVCAGTNVTFTATPTNGGGSPSYQWKLNGGNVGTNSSTYANSSLSDGDVVTCVLTSSETCTTGNPATSNAVTMTVNPLPTAPTSVSASPTSIVSGNSTTLSYTGGSGTTFNWYSGSCGGTLVGTGQDLSVSPTSTTTYYGAWENGCGISSCQSVTVTVTGGTGYTLSGQVSYDNGTHPAIANQTVNLYDASNNLVASTTTDASGNYSFSNVVDGSYTVTPAIGAPFTWGGATAMDVTIYKQDIGAGGGVVVTGVREISGCVSDGVPPITAPEMTTILRRIVALSYTFVGDWAYSDGSVTISGSNQTLNIYTVCYGDANASKSVAKDLQPIDVTNSSVIYVNSGDYFEIPVTVQGSVNNLSSVTLAIPYNNELLDITDVEMSNNNYDMIYSINEGVIRIAYSSLNAVSYNDGVLLTIKGNTKKEITNVNLFENAQGEFGDLTNNIITGINLDLPLLASATLNTKKLGDDVNIYPNPVTSYLTIVNAQNSNIEITNVIGQVLITSEVNTNNYKLDANNLVAGTYLIRIYKGDEVIVKKFVVLK